MRHEWSPLGPAVPRDSIFILWLRAGQTTRVTDPGPAESDCQPAWSGDGLWLAFESNRNGTEDVFVVDRKGNALRRVTPLGSNEFHPAWPTFGSQIALVSDRTGATEIYTLTVSPSPTSTPAMKQLTFDKAPKANPAWERMGIMVPAS